MLISARIRRMGKVLISVCQFTPGVPQCLVPCPFWGGDTPFSPDWRGGGVYPHPILMGVPWPGQCGILPIRTGWGYPPPNWDWMGSPSSSKTGWGTLPSTPEIEEQSKYLLLGGRYASCAHARGLSY